jgi:AP-4 complex subunit epsilon-1
MNVTLCALFDLVITDANLYKNLTISFISILKQVVEHRLSKLFDYHWTFLPFIKVFN